MKLKSDTTACEIQANIKEYNKYQKVIDEMHLKAYIDPIASSRLTALIDEGSFFLELSKFAGHQLYQQNTPSGGIITGIGQISGKPCMILINMPSIKAGCYFPITIKKTIRALKIARDFRLPCIHLVDSGGAFLPLQSELFANEDGFGRIFYEQAQLSSAGIIQYAAILSPCTAGGAYIPMMSDECVMVKGQGALFLAGPPLVAAATGEKVNTQDLGGSKVHCRQSGIVHKEVDSENEALQWLRSKIALLPGGTVKLKESDGKNRDDITGFIPSDPRYIPDINGILANILDHGILEEFQSAIGQSMRTGWGYIQNNKIAVVANDGIMDSKSMIKTEKFLKQCEKLNTPVLFLHNTHGMMVGIQAEKTGIARYGAELIKTMATLNIRCFTIMIGSSYGAGNYAMCGRAFNPSVLFQWPNNQIAIMGAQQQQKVLEQIGKPSEINRESFTAIYHSARLHDDGIIRPNETREILSALLKIGNFYD